MGIMIRIFLQKPEGFRAIQKLNEVCFRNLQLTHLKLFNPSKLKLD